jgi:hypothetical protein
LTVINLTGVDIKQQPGYITVNAVAGPPPPPRPRRRRRPASTRRT